MADEVRIGVEPAPTPPPRSGRVLGLALALVLLVAGGAWLLGALGSESAAPSTTRTAPTFTAPSTTTAGPTTTVPLAERLQRARAFWWALGQGDVAAAQAVIAAPTSGAGNLMAFVAAFRPQLTVGDCEPFAANAVACLVVVSNGDLLAIGTGTAEEVLNVADDGWFEVPAVVASAAARLSLYALEAHTEAVRAACLVTGDPNVARLAIVGSPTSSCGAYLAGLIPEYLSVVLTGQRGGW